MKRPTLSLSSRESIARFREYLLRQFQGKSPVLTNVPADGETLFFARDVREHLLSDGLHSDILDRFAEDPESVDSVGELLAELTSLLKTSEAA